MNIIFRLRPSCANISSFFSLMKLATSRILLVFASCQIFFMPTASAQGPYEKLIAAIQGLGLQGEIGTKVDAWLRRLSSFELEQDRPSLSDVVQQYEVKAGAQAEKQLNRALYSDKGLTPAGQQLGILWYVIHLVKGRFPNLLNHSNAQRFEIFLQRCPAARMLQQMLIYFDSNYEIHPETLKLFTKGSGDQLGITAQFALGDRQILHKYRVKTHSSGRSSNAPASEASDVDPHELFVYSVLEKAGLGPEVHFFRYDTKDFYIATRDVGDNGMPNSFAVSTYGQLEENPRVKEIVFDWMKKLESPKHWEALGDEIPVVVRALVQSNVTAHILNLTDLNGGNTCFVYNADQSAITSYRIVDFRPNEIEVDKNSFGAFKRRLPADGNEGNRYQFDERESEAEISMINRVLGTKSQDWFLVLARYFFPEKIFLAIDKAEERVAPIVRELYPPESPEAESGQSRLFKAQVQWFRRNAKTFFGQLNSYLMEDQNLSRLFFMAVLPTNSEWQETNFSALRDVTRVRTAEPSAPRTPPRSPAVRFPSIMSPSKSPGSPIPAPIEKAVQKADEEISRIFSLIRKAKGILQEPAVKKAILEIRQTIDHARNDARGITDEHVICGLVQQIDEEKAKIQRQKEILEKAIQDAQPAKKAVAAAKPKGPTRPPAKAEAASKSQGEPEDS
jgi:hypothetical protein